MDVESCIVVVEVGDFGEVEHSSVGHFQTGKHKGDVVGCSKVFPVLVLQVLVLDLAEEGSVG